MSKQIGSAHCKRPFELPQFEKTTMSTQVVEAIDPSTFILGCSGIALAWAAIQFTIISQTKYVESKFFGTCTLPLLILDFAGF